MLKSWRELFLTTLAMKWRERLFFEKKNSFGVKNPFSYSLHDPVAEGLNI